MKNILYTILLTIALLLPTACKSITGSSTGSITEWVEELRADGTRITKILRSEVENIIPPNAKEVGALSLSKDGFDLKETTTWENVETALNKGSKLFYVVGILLVVSGVVTAMWLKQLMLGASLAAGGGIVLLAPTIIPQIAPWVTWIVIGLILAGLAYVGGKIWQSFKTKKNGKAGADKLEAEGAVREAVAIRRATDSKFDELFTAAKAAVKTGK